MAELGMLLQRQAEVAGMLRERQKNADQLVATAATFHRLTTFFSSLNHIATRLAVPAELIFQCMIQIHAGGPLSFDQQHRDGNVPMHQAKVLNRGSALAAAAVEPRLRGMLPPDELDEHVALTVTLRRLLRMKVEDASDLAMAEKAVRLTNDFFVSLAALSSGSPAELWALYNAETPEEMHRFAGVSTAAESNQSSVDAATMALPATDDFLSSLKRQAEIFSSATRNAADRLASLNTVTQWLTDMPQQEWQFLGANSVALLSKPLRAQLGEKRSALCRAACVMLSKLAERTSFHQMSITDVREAFCGWLDACMKQVHVTVAAIAEATDEAVRDCIVSCRGQHFIVATLVVIAAKAAQPELQRKTVGYCCLALLSCPPEDLQQRSATVAVVARQLSQNSNESVRRVARALGILTREAGVELMWDEKVERIAVSESVAVLDAARQGVAAFETQILRYERPCKSATSPLKPWSVRTNDEAPAPSPTVDSTRRLSASQRSAIPLSIRSVDLNASTPNPPYVQPQLCASLKRRLVSRQQ